MNFLILKTFYFSLNNFHILIGIYNMYFFYVLSRLKSAFLSCIVSLLYNWYIPLIGFILQSAKKGANRDCLSSLISQSEGCGQARNYACAGVECSRAHARGAILICLLLKQIMSLMPNTKHYNRFNPNTSNNKSL